MADNVAAFVRLMLVTDDRLLEGRDLVALARAAERGGVTSVQLRLKRATAREQVAARPRAGERAPHSRAGERPAGRGARRRRRGSPPRPRRSAGGARPPDRAARIRHRRVGGHRRRRRPAAGEADYWGIGPWRVTATKEDAGTGWVPSGFGRLRRWPAAARPRDLAVCDRRTCRSSSRRGRGRGRAGILGAEDVEAAARRYVAVAGACRECSAADGRTITRPLRRDCPATRRCPELPRCLA